jgi:hypothetical protein
MRQSNIERQRLRDECRETLSQYGLLVIGSSLAGSLVRAEPSLIITITTQGTTDSIQISLV